MMMITVKQWERNATVHIINKGFEAIETLQPLSKKLNTNKKKKKKKKREQNRTSWRV